VLDPEGDDRRAFLRWVLGAVSDGELDDAHLDRLDAATPGYSSAAFAALRGQLKAQVALAKEQGRELDIDGILDVVADMIPADIGETRRYQTLQALINCTRRRLLPSSESGNREAWAAEIRNLEARGIR
ncbi:MAG: hypothetical protein AAFX50_12580, partial [Acidobacteriota bacterium]